MVSKETKIVWKYIARSVLGIIFFVVGVVFFVATSVIWVPAVFAYVILSSIESANNEIRAERLKRGQVNDIYA